MRAEMRRSVGGELRCEDADGAGRRRAMPCSGFWQTASRAPGPGAAVEPGRAGARARRSRTLAVPGAAEPVRRRALDRAGRALPCAVRPAAPPGRHRGVAQLAEQRSPKPQVAGSSPVTPAPHATTRAGAGPRRGAVDEDGEDGAVSEDSEPDVGAPSDDDDARPVDRRGPSHAGAAAGGDGRDADAAARPAPAPRRRRRARGHRHPDARPRRRPRREGSPIARLRPVPARGRRRAAQGHLADAAADLPTRSWSSCSWRSWWRWSPGWTRSSPGA